MSRSFVGRSFAITGGIFAITRNWGSYSAPFFFIDRLFFSLEDKTWAAVQKWTKGGVSR
jgi:hypothetical protein